MADVITTNTIFDGDKVLELNITNKSDGTGQTNEVFVDASNFTSHEEPVTHFLVEEIQWSSQGFDFIELAFDADTDVPFDLLSANGYKNYKDSGGIVDPKGAGFTGDIIVTTIGPTLTASYDITIRLIKKI